jgi:hypothetical protein
MTSAEKWRMNASLRDIKFKKKIQCAGKWGAELGQRA